MIVVLVGGSVEQRDRIIGDLMLLKQGYVQSVNLSHISTRLARLDRLKFEISPSRSFSQLTIVNNVESESEYNLLKEHEREVIFAHVYGAMTGIYDKISIQLRDVFVFPTPFPSKLPDHVLTPEELLSEVQTRVRQERTKRHS